MHRSLSSDICFAKHIPGAKEQVSGTSSDPLVNAEGNCL